MRLRVLCALSLFAGLGYGFQDTSPFFAFSDSAYFDSSTLTAETQVSRSETITSSIVNKIQEEGCSSDVYILASLPGVTSKDFRDGAAPWLQTKLADAEQQLKSNIVVPDVLGAVDLHQISEALKSSCKAVVGSADAGVRLVKFRDEIPQIIPIDFTFLPSSPNERKVDLEAKDSFLASVVDATDSWSYTVVFITTPPSSAEHIEHGKSFDYDAENPFPEAMREDLKRDLTGHLRRQAAPNASRDNRGLFEKYNFLSGGIFMGLFAVIILISILQVGLKAVSGLEVSYATFSKEMGPSAQKKQQQ